MKKVIDSLEHIRKRQGSASTVSLMKELDKEKDYTNEMIEHLCAKGLIDEPERMCNGIRISLRITNQGKNLLSGTG